MKSITGDESAPPSAMVRILKKMEDTLFSHKRTVLGVLICFTAVMGIFAIQLRMDAGFEKQLPIGHEYVDTFQQYRSDLLGANRLSVVVKAKKGTIWTPSGLKRLYDVTQALKFLPNVSGSSVQSLWTPNSFVSEITEDGFRDAPINLSCSRGKLQFSRHLQRHWTKSDRKIMYGELFRPVLRVKREPHPYP